MIKQVIELFSWQKQKGQMGGVTVVEGVQLVTTSTPDYTSGDCIGGAFKLEGLTRRNKTGIIQSVKVEFEASIAPINCDVYFFSKRPTATDNDAFAATAAELKFMVPGKVELLAADADTAISTIQSLYATNIGMPYQALPESDGSTNIWCVVVLRDALNLATTSGMHVTVGALID